MSSNTLCSALTSTLMESAAAQIPAEQQQHRAKWLTDGTLQLILVRRRTAERCAALREQERVLLHRAAVRTRQQSQRQVELQQKLYEGLQLLKLQRKSIKRAVRGDKQRYAETIAEKAMAAKREGTEPAFWGFVKQVGKPLQARPPQCNIADADGILQAGSAQQAEAMAEHFRRVLGSGQPVAKETLEGIRCTPNPQREPPPTLEEVHSAVKRLRRSRALDSEGLSAELLQAAGPAGILALHQLVVSAWEREMLHNLVEASTGLFRYP